MVMKKILIIIFLIFPYSKIFGQESDTTIYAITEIQPSFQYGNCTITRESCKKYFLENFRMPKELSGFCFEGKIMIMFVLEKDGSISNAKVLRGIDSNLDSLVLETVKSMPKWFPGKIKGKIVRSQFFMLVSIEWLY
jgi:hypothetical protein